MKKKILALLTSLAMLVSVAPVVFAEGEATDATYLDAYTTVDTFTNYASLDGSTKTSGATEGIHVANGNVYFNVNFGETAPLGLIVESGYGDRVYGRMYIEVDDGTGNYVELGYMDPFITGGYNANYGWQKNRYVYLNENASLCKGNKSIRFSVKTDSTFSKVHSFKFFTDAQEVASIAPAYTNAYESLKANFSVKEKDSVYTSGKYTYQVGAAFGETAPENLIFEVTRTSQEAATLESIDLRLDKTTLVATVPEISVDAGETVTQYVKVSNPEQFVGNMNVRFQFTNQVTDISNIDFKFINTTPASPYAQLVSDPFKLEQNFGLVDFGEKGAKSVEVNYAGQGQIAINGTVIADLPVGDNVTETISLTPADYKGIQNLTVTLTDVSVSSLKFNEMTFDNPFDKDTVDAVYIGAAVTEEADWTLAIEEKLAANSTEYYGTTFENTDVVVPVTDAAKLDLVKNVPNGDIIFIQASDFAESLVKAYADLSTVPYVIVVGTASYADTYGIKAITADGEGLGANETYQKPAVETVVTKNPYLNISAYNFDDSTITNTSGNTWSVNGFNSWTNGGKGYVYKGYDFSDGVSKVQLYYSHADQNLGATIDIKIDGYDGTTVATFVKTEQTTGTWVTLESPALIPVTGVHDVYLVNRYRGAELSVGSVFGNVQWVKFVAAESYDEMTAANAVTATEVEGNIYLDASTTATFAKIADITKLASLPATIAATGTGVVKVKNGDNVLATIDLAGADGNFNKVLGTIADDAVAATDLTLVYEGDGHCYIESINLKTLDVLTTTFDSTNYSDKLSTVSISTSGQFGGLACTPDHPDKFVKWSNVDFGEEVQILDLSTIIGFSRVGTGEAVNIYVDEVSDENLIAQVISSSVRTTKDEYPSAKDAHSSPMTNYPTGIHDVILKVENSNAANSHQDNRFVNLWSFSFTAADSTDAIRVVEKEINKVNIVDSVETRYLMGMNTVVSFMDGADIPDSYMVVAALYDSTGKLIDIDLSAKTTVENGLNGASVELSFEGLADGTYTYKYFFWNGANLQPISTNATQVTLPTIK